MVMGGKKARFYGVFGVTNWRLLLGIREMGRCEGKDTAFLVFSVKGECDTRIEIFKYNKTYYQTYTNITLVVPVSSFPVDCIATCVHQELK